MFNFFDEIKSNIKKFDKMDLLGFDIVNVSGKLLYVEGHMGLLVLSHELISFKVKGGVFTVFGKGLILEELTENTLKISGQISSTEQI